jgi:carboxymethylenebutenolidase
MNRRSRYASAGRNPRVANDAVIRALSGLPHNTVRFADVSCPELRCSGNCAKRSFRRRNHNDNRKHVSRQTGDLKMAAKDVKISSTSSGQFDCYLATPASDRKVPAIVLASAVHGVDQDIRAIADEFAWNGYIAAAPDLFWRSIPGPLARDDNRTKQRSQPRAEKIKAGETDMADTLAELRKLPHFNGRAAVMGFCYGGPYAILGPKRLGYEAGISCHGTQLLDYIAELEGVTQPVCIIWGDQDHQAPPNVLDAYRSVPARMKNVEVHIFPGVLHGYMMRDNPDAFDEKTRDFSMKRALAILEGLRTEQRALA